MSSHPATRAEAKAQGSSFYYTGKPCKRGHLSPRFVASQNCVQCKTEYQATNPSYLAKKAENDRARKATPQYKSSWQRYCASLKGKATRAAYVARRKKEDPQFAIAASLRSRLARAISNGCKQGSAVSDLGMTLPEFKAYCETHPNWQPDWTWAGLGTVFQLDHIKPLGLFDLTDVQQLKQAVHYTNIQPLSVADHKVKTATDVQMIQARAQIQSLSL